MTLLTNLFDLSPRELTNSAFWGWLLDGLRDSSDTPRRRGAVSLLQLLKVPTPEKILAIQTERPLPDGRRLDVSLEGVADGKRFHLFIENKVRPDAGMDAQVAGYCEALQKDGSDLYPVFFRSYCGRATPLRKSEPWPVRDLGIEEMISLLESVGAAEGSILQEFLNHLRGRQARSRQASETITRGGADPEMWMAVAQQNEVEELFAEYLALAESTGSSRVDFNNGRSVAVRYSPLPHLVGSPVFSLHLHRSSASMGLRVGYNHVNWHKAFSRPFPASLLPADFADEPDSKQPNWHFGHFRNIEELDCLFQAVTATKG